MDNKDNALIINEFCRVNNEKVFVHKLYNKDKLLIAVLDWGDEIIVKSISFNPLS